MSRFDRVMGLTVALILAGIGVTLLLGDRVGVTVDHTAPQGEARSTSRISLRFSEPMDRASAEARFRTDPALDGAFTWNGATLFFTPERPLPPGDTVHVALDAGATSASGRAVLNDTAFSFTVRRPEVAYLYPAVSSPANIWIAPPAAPQDARQVTFSPTGVFDFSVSPDGAQIAFSEFNSGTGATDIKLLDLASGGLTQLTNCLDARCTRPVWRPDGRTIAYERIDYNTALADQGVGPSPNRVWLLDLTAVPATTRPLMSDLQMVGHSPQWSADGQTIAFYSTNLGAIVVYNVDTGELVSVPSGGDSSGALSPDAARLAFPEIVVNEGTGVNSYLKLADLAAGEERYLSEPGQPIDDSRVVWRPEGDLLTVARRDLRVARTYQAVEMDPATGETRPLTDDPRYSNMFFWWDPTGEHLVLQRFPELDETMQPNLTGRPEVWTLDRETGALTLIQTDAMLPRWVP
jgi:hypothetical protein